MKEYARPVAVVTDGLSEGVFAASGASAGTGGSSGISYDVSLVQTGSEWNGKANHTLVITPDAAYDGKPLNVSVTFDKKVEQFWNATETQSASGYTYSYGNEWNRPIQWVQLWADVGLKVVSVKLSE